MYTKVFFPAVAGAIFYVLNVRAQNLPTITLQPTNQTVLVGSSLSFNVAVSGAGPFTYQWQFNGSNLPNSFITTVAGGSLGDNGSATNAALSQCQGVALDAAGNLFIADSGNHRICKVATNGIISTVAGNGRAGYAGDGGAATNANLAGPQAVAVDSLGNLFVADTGNDCIRKVDTNGIVSTVAGTGFFPGSFYGDGGLAINARLNSPSDIACNAAGELFIADAYNQRIRKVDTNGLIKTIAGNGSNTYSGDGGLATNAALNTPRGVSVDSSGNVFIADSNNNRVRKVSSGGVITTVAGKTTNGFVGDGGLATNARLYDPIRVTVDGSGNLFISDYFNERIRKVNTSGIINTVAGNGTNGFSGDGGLAVNASLSSPGSVAVNASGNFFIADFSGRIRKVNTSGIISTVAGSGLGGGYAGDGGAASQAMLNSPNSVAVDSTGALFITDTSNHRIRKVAANGIISTVAGNGTNGFSGDGGAATNASLNSPGEIAFDGSGTLYFADTLNHRIRKVTPNGIISTVAGNGTNAFSGDGGAATNASLNSPFGIAFDAIGNLFIADTQNHRIRKMNTSGVISTVAGNDTWASFSGDGGPATNASLSFPQGIRVDALGNLFTSEAGGNRVRKVDTNGIITIVAGNGYPNYSGDGGAATNASLYFPAGIELDASGNIYIVDNSNNRIREVDTNGIISTVVGNGSWPYSGENIAATNASLNFPQGVVRDALGNLFIADTGDNRIREVAYTGYPTLTLNNVTTNNAGTYSVVISNSHGSVTSSTVSLTIVLPSAPTILTQPTNQTVLAGTSASFNVAPSGTGPFTYQWLFNGTNLPGNGNPALILNNTAVSNAGNYSVIVTGPSGIVTSSIVTLTVLVRPSITRIVHSVGGGVTINFTGGAGEMYLVQAATNLAPPVVWQTISTNTAGTNGTWQFTDNPTPARPMRFYRSTTP